MDEGEEELMPQGTQWKVPEVQEDKGTSPTISTWGLLVACVVAAVLLVLILSFASFKLLSSRKRKASLEVTPVTQIATIQLRNGDRHVPPNQRVDEAKCAKSH